VKREKQKRSEKMEKYVMLKRIRDIQEAKDWEGASELRGVVGESFEEIARRFWLVWDFDVPKSSIPKEAKYELIKPILIIVGGRAFDEKAYGYVYGDTAWISEETFERLL
jgi:hypothetical protein